MSEDMKVEESRLKETAEEQRINSEEESGGNRGRTAWRIAVGLCLLLIAAAVVMRLMKPEEAVETSPLPTVSVISPEYGDIEIETSLVGTVMPDNVYYVVPKTSGEIKEIYVEQGDTVNEGDPICRIDNDAQIDSAKITLDSAKVQLETARLAVNTASTNLDRMNALYASGDISRQSWESADSGYEQAKAQLDAAELQVEGAQLAYDLQVENAVVTAPVTGVIESESMEINAIASPSAQVCVISGSGIQKVVFSVTDRLLDGISAGDRIRLEKQGETYEAVVKQVASMPDTSTGLYPVEASIEGDTKLVTGSGIKVYFSSESSRDVLTIPTDAVYYDGGLTYAYTLSFDDEQEGAEGSELDGSVLIAEGNRPGTVHKVEIKTGLSDGTSTEILEGISEEDTVIRTWTAQLYEGAKVQVLPGNGTSDTEEPGSGATGEAAEAGTDASAEAAEAGEALS